MEECLSTSVGHGMYLGFSYLLTRQEGKHNPNSGSEGSSLNGSTGISLRWQAVTTCHRLSTCPKPLVEMEFQISPENISHL